MVSAPASKVRCRQIQPADFEAVAEVLTSGFEVHPRKYWTTALERLAARGAPQGCPPVGYLLEADGEVVGVQLLIFSEVDGQVRCNVSSWYVEPAHRGHAALLAAVASKLKHVTYLNTSPARHTWPILDALGYRRYCAGQLLSFPAIKPGKGRARPVLAALDADLPEFDLLSAHVQAGCLALVCDRPTGPQPFVFLRRRIARLPFPVMQLVFARSTESFVDCAGPLGRWLLARGAPAALCDAEGPIAGLPGMFFENRTPRYFKGPDAPRLNDLAFTEMVVFGP